MYKAYVNVRDGCKNLINRNQCQVALFAVTEMMERIIEAEGFYRLPDEDLNTFISRYVKYRSKKGHQNAFSNKRTYALDTRWDAR